MAFFSTGVKLHLWGLNVVGKLSNLLCLKYLNICDRSFYIPEAILLEALPVGVLEYMVYEALSELLLHPNYTQITPKRTEDDPTSTPDLEHPH
jgi:hypothetical protein